MIGNRARIPAVLAAALLTGAVACAGAESDSPEGSQPAAERQAEADIVPAGTEVAFRVMETVSTADHSAGDDFTVVVGADVTTSDGTVRIPEGAPARGRVLRSDRGTVDEPAVLALSVESLQVDGEWVPIEATLTAAEVENDPADTGSETAGKIAIGAAAGALLGQILGKDTESTLKGAGAGAVAGVVVALTSREGNATIRQGTLLRVRLDEPITLQ